MSALLKTMAQRLSFASRLAGTPLVVPTAARPSPAARCLATQASMGKRDLIKVVQEKTGLTGTQADAAVNAVLDTIVTSVAHGQKVTIPGFGVFEARTRAARRGRNPKTGEEIQIAETVAPGFSAGKGFKDIVKGAGK